MVSTGFAFGKNEIQQIIEMFTNHGISRSYPNPVKLTNTRAYTEDKTKKRHIKLFRSLK